MKHSLFTFFLTFFMFFNGFSQEEQINLEAINNYKYVIVPLKYDFLNDADQYQINSLTEFLFNKYGYEAYLENEDLPQDYINNTCLGLKADVVKVKGGFLAVKLKINLLDCNGQVIVSSKVGKSREKEFKTAYNLALRDAFNTFQFHKYEYNLVKANHKSSSGTSNINSIEDSKVEEGQMSKNNAQQKEDVNLLYAQPIDQGFQVVDSTPKVIMILLETPKENTFIVKDQNAIVYKEDGFWYLSKNDGKSTSLETVNIKF